MRFRLLRDEKGSALVEVALMLPIILGMVFGFLFFTHAVRMNTVLEVAAREAARNYAVTHDLTKAKNKAKDELAMGNINPAKAVITVSSVGNEKRASVKMPFPIQIPFFGLHDLMLEGQAVFHEEVQTSYW